MTAEQVARDIYEAEPFEWPDPEPLTIQGDQPDEYPLRALPDPLLRAATEVSRFAKVPVASPAVIGLSVAATTIGRRARIEERPGLRHNMALFQVLIASSGERKSPAFKHMTAGLEEWEKDQETRWQEQIHAIQAANAISERIISQLERDACKDILDADRNALVQRIAAEKARVRETPPHPRLFTTDPTEERLFQMMHDREGVFAVLSGEGRQVIDNIMGRRSGDGYTGDAIYLAGITGDTITRDRIGASQSGPESRVIREPMLNVCVMVQPDKYMDAALHPRLRDSGALARIWPVRLPSLIGTRIEEPDEGGLDAAETAPFHAVVRSILDHEVRRDDDGCPVPHLIHLGTDAAEARRDWHNVIERMMANGGELEDVRDIASKAVSATVKAAGIIHVLQHPDYLAASASEVPLATWRRAQFLGEYHLSEAIRIQRAAGEDHQLYEARRVLRWLAQHAIDRFKARDLQRKGPRPRPDAKQAEQVCAVLMEYGWIKKLPDAAGYVAHPNVANVARGSAGI